ncbi:MAG: hypothetical protein EOP42_28785 [Sphingobacteriaceae bacterium]|nr:MAG: hypothetical protein EOP42_28785 [Sphingobacteriaceae bacterium]
MWGNIKSGCRWATGACGNLSFSAANISIHQAKELRETAADYLLLPCKNSIAP